MGILFTQRRNEYCAAVERQLDAAIGQGDPLCAPLFDAMRYAALSGGKRLRAMLTLEFCRISCGDWRRALPFAAAAEMIHAYSMIHDDLPCMDDDAMRRGKPSCHIRFGEADALLAGDALQALAFESMARDCDASGIPAQNIVHAMMILARGAGPNGMCGGQQIDLASEKLPEVSPETLRALHAKKTGALIRAASLMGAVVGGMPETGHPLCDSYASDIGLAFQIVDDILDVTATGEALGKTPGKDAGSGKTTYVTLYGIEGARSLADELICSAKRSLTDLGVEDPFLFKLADLVTARDH